jgi:DNA polymerase-3 subunit epsilon
MKENAQATQLIKGLNFCVIDLETTGGNHDKDQIIEIGMVKIKSCEIQESKGYLVNPKRNIPEFIQKLTSISQDDVKDAPVIDEIIDEIISYIGDDILVAHNTSFDIPFLNSVMRRLGREEFTNPVICTNVMTKYMIPEIMNSNLNYMCHLFNIEHKHAHRAEEDAKASAKLLIQFLKIFIEKNIKKINQLYYPQNKFELDRIHLKSQDEVLSKIDDIQDYNSRFVFTFKGKKGVILGVFPCSNIKEEKTFILELLDTIPWETVTIKIIGPLMEGLFLLNNHYNKYPEDIKDKIIHYLNTRYTKKKDKRDINNLDFILAPHLISEQVVVYSFLSLHTNNKPIFKYPGHKKKLIQFLKSQINRFENNQKRRKKHNIQKDIIPIVESVLTHEEYLPVSIKVMKETDDNLHSTVENFLVDHHHTFSFPNEHL